MTTGSSPHPKREFISEFEYSLANLLYPIVGDESEAGAAASKALSDFLSVTSSGAVTAATSEIIDIVIPKLLAALSNRRGDEGTALSSAIIRLHCIASGRSLPVNGATETLLAEIAESFGVRYFLHVDYASPNEGRRGQLNLDVFDQLPSPVDSSRRVDLRGGDAGEELFVTLDRIGENDVVERLLETRVSLKGNEHKWPINIDGPNDEEHVILSIASNGTPIVRARLSELAQSH